ncbi:MAG: elongation factor 4 [Opitutales bacterium]|jgi:GTP-binding protein LepA|nr:elongation factor 4 [Opitutales bacterium]MDG2256190.1 translation elongation factor 4 [Opitutaceae bacterium]MBT5169698.1 elongation factor 4 [Opitutales bacterium]MBT5815532.1 elongation factor 4 [Opitutales bacterium]MBT6380203.1 elongation factor 4 [Opitutales bacterium]
METDHKRNFSIIAHVDHGKTTLSDRLLEYTSTVTERVLTEQHLDSMDLERERGITIKSHPVTMAYKADDGELYQLNLMDTPGHVDFSYEVSRSLAACEGALLLIDAAQGVEAQTVANANLAVEQKLTIIPVINKIDLPSANLDLCLKQLEDLLAIPAEEAILASAKNGIGIKEILEAITKRVPGPRWSEVKETRVGVFDSVYDAYRGAIIYARSFSGELKRGDNIMMMSDATRAEVKEVGVFTPSMQKTESLKAGDVGYLVCNIKNVADIKIGDTITHYHNQAKEMLPGYQEVRPLVFSGIYPVDTNEFEKLKAGMGKLQLNDAAFSYQAESSMALGFGFRCGFLGLLHMEIIQERVRREYDVEIISTYPSVIYKVEKANGDVIEVDNPINLPDPSAIERILEPTIRATIHVPNESIGDILNLVMDKRGVCDHTETLDENRLMIVCNLPLNEILVDFNDRLKSITRGYGSMDYELDEYRESKLVKMDIMVNADPVDAFSSIVHQDKAREKGKLLCDKLADIIPMHLFKIAVQAAVGGNIIARANVRAMRKDVTAKCYGGDISRKRKLLDKQKEGKRKMKNIGNVSIPPDAFIKVLKSD